MFSIVQVTTHRPVKLGKRPLQLAIYGKGGIGKSTIASNVAAALSVMGYRVLLVGCDPKHDCTMCLRDGKDIPTILDVLREKGLEGRSLENILREDVVKLEEIVFRGSLGVYIAESGGPKPGHGCAGRGVLLAIETLRKLDAFRKLDVDVVIYDVLGDVVCGGFAMPLRSGFADSVYIVVSSDYASIYAANNICRGIAEFAGRGGSPLGGLIYNVKSPLLDEEDVVQMFARELGTQVMFKIPYSPLIAEAESECKTVIEYAPDSLEANLFRELALKLISNSSRVVPKPLPPDRLSQIGKLLQERVRAKTRR